MGNTLAAEIIELGYKPEQVVGPTKIDPLSKVRRILAKSGYEISDSGELMRKVIQKIGKIEAEVCKLVANCILWVTSEITRDDGMTQTKRFTVAGRLAGGQSLPETPIPADQFANMNWTVKCWGLSVNIEPGQGNRDYLRHAIQLTAQGIPSKTVYSHLGWRKIGNEWEYLHAGMTGKIEVDVSEEGLQRYVLPMANPARMKTAVEMLDVGPHEITFPLMGLMFLAPLGEPLRKASVEPSFVVWLVGLTGAMKSTLAGLFLSFFGRFDSRSLPGNFRDTANSLEKRAFACKDSVFVIDDYHPCSTDNEARQMQSSAQKLLRAFGDRQGRARMNSDSSIKQAYIPRGMALVTGEDLPDVGQSGSARYFALELKRGDIDKEKLTDLQARTDELASVMAAYTEWLSPQIDNLSANFRQQFEALRMAACQHGEHGRIPETVAWLQLGFSAFLKFAVETGSIKQTETDQLAGECWTILNKLAAEQSRTVNEDRPARKFLDALRDMLDVKTVWVRHFSCVDSPSRDGQFIGWEDSDHYLLIPGETYKQVVKFTQAKGSRFPINDRRLWGHLASECLIETVADDNRVNNTILRTIDGKRQRVLALKKSALDL